MRQRRQRQVHRGLSGADGGEPGVEPSGALREHVRAFGGGDGLAAAA